MVDLTESDDPNGTEQETENLLPGDCQIKKENSNKNQTSNKQDFNLQMSSSKESAVLAPQPDCGNLKPKRRCLKSQTQHQTTPCFVYTMITTLTKFIFSSMATHAPCSSKEKQRESYFEKYLQMI